MNTTNQKTPTTLDIKDAAVELMDANGSTTNLDIKNHLRSKGFWVSQDEVSSVMNSSEISGVVATPNFNGRYNVWTKIVQDSNVQDATQDSSTQDATQSNVIVTPSTQSSGSTDVISVICSKLGIYKQAVNANSNLQKDLGFIDRDFTVIGQTLGVDITACKTVQDIINLTK